MNMNSLSEQFDQFFAYFKETLCRAQVTQDIIEQENLKKRTHTKMKKKHEQQFHNNY